MDKLSKEELLAILASKTDKPKKERKKPVLDDNKKVICNLFDKNGKIGMQIISIYNDYENEICILELKNGEKIDLKDNYLYNIIYNMQKDSYSLEAEDEFFEKIPVKNED